MILALALAAAQLLLFVALDRRTPDDHDPFYTDASIPWVLQIGDAPAWRWPGVLADHFVSGELHPRLAQTELVAWLGVFGPSRAAYRLANLPFLLLLVLGTALLARELRVRHPGLVAFALATLPLAVHASRKWDLQFHAAALTPLGLWLGVRAVQRGGRGAWLAFGAFQGLRLYSHPIVLPDVALSLLLFPALSGGGVGPRLRSLGQAAGAALLLGSLDLGLLGDVGWSLPRYLQQRGDYSEVGWWVTADGPARLGLLVETLSEVAWIDVFPPLFAVGLLGIGLSVALGRRRGALDPGDARRWPLVVGLLLLGAAEVPVVALAHSNQAFVGDWLFVAPGLAVAAAWGLERALPGWGARLAAGVVVAQGLLVLAVPLALGAFGPQLLADPGFYDRGPLRLLVRSASGRHGVTHHIPSRSPSPTTRLARAMAQQGAESLEIYDLSWDPAAGGEAGCHLGDPEAAEGWRWAVPEEALNAASRPLSPWPWVFAGLGPPELRRPDLGGAAPGAQGLRLVRLWLQPTPQWSDADISCVPRARLGPSFLAGARSRVGERFSGGSLSSLPDPAGRLVGRVVDWDRSPFYVGHAYLVRGSAPQVDLELDADRGAQAAPGAGGEAGAEGAEAVQGEMDDAH